MSLRNATLRLMPPGSVVLFLFFLTGIWVTMSPFAMTTQPSGQPWIASTINNVTLGAILMVVSLVGILAYLALELRDLLLMITIICNYRLVFLAMKTEY